MTGRTKKQLKRLGLLTQIQKKKVELASAHYHSVEESLNQALEKLEGLEHYFEHGPPLDIRGTFSVSLVETEVFNQRLRTAIAAQQSACQQLRAQCESARLLLVAAEHRRAGLEKVEAVSAQQARLAAEFRLQRDLEDSLTARHGRNL